MTANEQGLLSVIEFEKQKIEQMNNKELLTNFIEYAKSRHIFPILHSDIEPLVDDYLQEQLLQQTPCTTQLEFEKPQMNVAALDAKMKKFFDTVTSDELIERFEKLGYEFKQIDEPPIA